MWEHVKNLDIGIFSVDNEMDIDETCEFFADSKMIAGNVAPVYTICNGTQENIEDEVKRCILSHKRNRSRSGRGHCQRKADQWAI